jgi:ribosomal protein L20
MNALRREGIHLNRKVLADLAVRERETFSRLIERAKEVMKT